MKKPLEEHDFYFLHIPLKQNSDFLIFHAKVSIATALSTKEKEVLLLPFAEIMCFFRGKLIKHTRNYKTERYQSARRSTDIRKQRRTCEIRRKRKTLYARNKENNNKTEEANYERRAILAKQCCFVRINTHTPLKQRRWASNSNQIRQNLPSCKNFGKISEMNLDKILHLKTLDNTYTLSQVQ